jgi:hypothetical protein
MANTYVSPEPDYRIDGFDAATERIEKDFLSVTLSDDMSAPIDERHSADGRHNFCQRHSADGRHNYCCSITGQPCGTNPAPRSTSRSTSCS